MSSEIEYLKDMVGISSVSGYEQGMTDYILGKSQALGGQVTELDGNLAVHIPGEDREKVFFLSGHMDTVPPTDEWSSEPLKLQADPNDPDRLIGLGSSDMKSGLAIMLGLQEQLQNSTPPKDIWMLFSKNEETDLSGSKKLAEWLDQEVTGYYKTLGGLILEPTNSYFVGVGHRGDTLWTARASGPGGHASQDFNDDKPPIEKIGDMLHSLPVLRKQWSAEYSDDLLGSPSINPTILRAGETDNVVPTTTEMVLNLRVTPKLVEALPRIRDSLAQRFDVDITQSWSPKPSVCSSKEQIYKTLKATMPAAEMRSFPGVTEQSSYASVPMLIYGPGDINAMHQPDEWVDISTIQKCAANVIRVIQNF